MASDLGNASILEPPSVPHLEPRVPQKKISRKGGLPEAKRKGRAKRQNKDAEELLMGMQRLDLITECTVPVGTGLVLDERMTEFYCPWDKSFPECPERLVAIQDKLLQCGLLERCVSVLAQEISEEEILLAHSQEYLALMKSTKTMSEDELRSLSDTYDSVYLHPNSYHCACLAAGSVLQLVKKVLSGELRNGLAVVRPPGHHAQHNKMDGYCMFNSVGIAAQYARQKLGVERVLIVDWDVHHGQGIQYIFDEDPSVLYFSWHRFEHQQFWPLLRASDYDAVGQGKGKGFNINVPWNKVGMGNADYVAAFFHVLLPLAFEFDPELVLVSAGYDSGIGDPEGQMCATPECFAHLTHFLMHLAKGKMCMILEGGYHLRSLSESVCMTIKTLLGDPLPRLSGEMAPCLSALESIHNVRAAHKQYWKCLAYESTIPLQDLSTRSYQTGKAESAQTGAQLLTPQEAGKSHNDEVIKTDKFLELHMKKIMSLRPPVRMAVVTAESHTHLLPPSVQSEEKTNAKELNTTISGFDPELVKEENVLKMLTVLEKIIKKEVTNGLAKTSVASLSLAFALKHCCDLKVQKVLCVFVGDMDMKIDSGDGKVLLINISAKQSEQSNTKYNIFFHWKEDNETTTFFSAVAGFILPVAYSYQPDLTIIVVGRNQSLSNNGVSLLINLLQGLAQSQVFVLIQDTELKLMQDIIKILTGDFTPFFGSYTPALKENVQMIKELRQQFQQEWKMLQCSVVSSAER